MKQYIIKRILIMIPTLLGITLLSFFLIQMTPGGPAEIRIMAALQDHAQNQAMTREIIEQTKKLYGLDKPITLRYFLWVQRIFTLQFGNSFTDHRPVSKIILERLPYTLQLNILSILLTYLFAIPLGIFSAVERGKSWERLSTVGVFALYSLPGFWVALLLMQWFGQGSPLSILGAQGLPISGLSSTEASTWPWAQFLWDRVLHLILPVICLSYGSLAYLSRIGRVGMLEALSQPYIQAARAKGLTEKKVVFVHAFRNALIPLFTVMGYLLPALFGGSVIIEYIFSIPGLGQLGFDSILGRDYPVVMALLVISSFLTLLGLFVSDLAYAWADPRISFEKLGGN